MCLCVSLSPSQVVKLAVWLCMTRNLWHKVFGAFVSEFSIEAVSVLILPWSQKSENLFIWSDLNAEKFSIFIAHQISSSSKSVNSNCLQQVVNCKHFRSGSLVLGSAVVGKNAEILPFVNRLCMGCSCALYCCVWIWDVIGFHVAKAIKDKPHSYTTQCSFCQKCIFFFMSQNIYWI